MFKLSVAETFGTFELPSTWWEWSIWVLALLASVFLVRLTVALDLNAFLKSRRDMKIVRLQNACPHLFIDHLGEGNFRVTSCFESPPGTLMSICNRCQRTSWNPRTEFDGSAEYFTSNIDAYLQAEKRFVKLLKKYRYFA